MMPMPLQSVAASLFSIRARVNIPFAVLACWLTNPFTEPFLRVFQEYSGGWVRERGDWLALCKFGKQLK